MKKRLLIFTADYGSDQLPTVFLRSARQAGVQADIVLLRHKSDPEVEREIQRYYPTACVFAPLRHELLRVVRRALLSTRLATPAAGLARAAWTRGRSWRDGIEALAPYLMGIMVSRFFLARAYLEARKNRYSAVLLTDSRDVVFQRDPMEDFEGGLMAGLENCAIENQPQNREWLQKVYGESPEGFDDLWRKPVICAGVTLGSTAQALAYLNLMCAEFMEKLPRLAYQNYLDQAVHNKILHLDPHGLDLRLTDNSKGTIVNLATSDLSEFDEDWSNGLRGKDGRLASIVHQYDRHPELMRSLLARLESAPEQKAATNARAAVGSQL